ncbi:GSCFA domain-containing protein [Myroides sp. 1354]|uniref:GSCFA domain-containing protein n=1 Tax=unclassified Myroides TaxID=2642485 RepID=UPI002577E66A|nr:MULTISPECIES: GSCFA domain-containing protein [unclassified Myroides]MDM1043896.1 GSCFA domain-containing protein [Myroides sp. R163-1]MDM1054831.1 GSCFA domain-containing protein [Myroides sp. 1354]MDM1068128.1 GSCFA domain-containing protein [Myroides sp. 1372]
MNFSTVVPLSYTGKKITYDDKILCLGSCFAVNIGEKFKAYQFQQTINPFGILFHPKAIERLVDYAVKGYEFTAQDVFEHQEIWSSFVAHSDLNELEQEDIVTKLNVKLFDLQVALRESTYITLTFGTAWVYALKETSEIVANCHKVPNTQFDKRLLSYEEVVDSYKNILSLIRTVNSEAQILCSISPVRHIKDGFVPNQRSKSILHAALQEVIEELVDEKVSYVPVYEIVMDELRDYRFYTADLIHPNDIAIHYIWERFVFHYIDEQMYGVMKKVDEVQKGLNHRPFNPTAEQHLKFLDTLIEKIDDLLERYPFMSFR